MKILNKKRALNLLVLKNKIMKKEKIINKGKKEKWFEKKEKRKNNLNKGKKEK